MKKHALALIPLLMASTALANPATQEGADHLTEVFQTYLGTVEGVVDVKADGDTYAVTLDAAPFIAMGKDNGIAGTISPIELSLTDNGDGTWAVTEDQPLKGELTLPEGGTVNFSVEAVKSEGTFDEKLMAFSTKTFELTGVKTDTVMGKAESGMSHNTSTIESVTGTGTSVANAAGGVDTHMTTVGKNQSSTMDMPAAGEGGAPQSISYTIEGNSQDVTVTGLKTDATYKAIAWFVAHPGQDAMKADKAGLKTVMTDWFPIFGNVNGTGTVTNISVQSPVGTIGIAEIKSSVDINGVVAEGKARMGFALSGVTLPEGLLPAWAAPILPQKASFDVQVTEFDAAAGGTALLGALDLPEGMADTTEFDKSVQTAFLPKGTVTITMNPSAVTGDGYELTYEGAMVAGPNAPVPTGVAKVTLTGADKLQAALQAAPDDIKGQAMMGFGMAQGMAKQEGGKLVWDIDASKPGSLLVNGTPMMGGN
jgi:hypothetical protein